MKNVQIGCRTCHVREFEDTMVLDSELESNMGMTQILWKSHIFGFFFFIAFCQVFPRPFSLFWLSILLPFLFFNLVFYRPLFSPFFFALVLSLFFGHLVSTLAYPNLHGNKRLDCYCCCEYFMQGKYCMSADTQLNVFHASKLFV
jgi:hypothetical protein